MRARRASVINHGAAGCQTVGDRLAARLAARLTDCFSAGIPHNPRNNK